VLDEWFGKESFDLERLPPDTAMHNRKGAMRALRQIIRRYQPVASISDGTISPGDILIVGQSGPGHAMIAGPKKNTLWQSSAQKVHFTGMALPHEVKLFEHYRIMEAAAWSSA
jgi:hypothetical protein